MRVLRVSHSAVVDAWRERERLLVKGGNQVATITARVWNEGGRDVALIARPGESVVGVRTWGTHPALFVYDPRPLWRALGEHWDVLDIHEEPFALASAEVLLLRALRRSRVPYALYSAQNLAKRYPIPFRWLERRALRGAAGMAVCNREAGEICRDKGLGVAPRVIGLGVDPNLFAPGAGAPPDGIVGYAGRLAPHKGVGVLLEAIAASPSLTLRIAGGGPDEPALRERAGQPDLAGRVEFVGSLGETELADFYRGISVLAVPSLTTDSWVEQFGRVAIEAMACGTPVVASASGALPDVVADAGVLVPEGDPTALAKALVRVCVDATVAADLRERGLERAAGFSWTAIAAQYRSMYRSMLHEALPVPRPVEVIVVAFHAPALLRRALRPLLGMAITVVDNSSDPAVRAVCAELGVRYLDPKRNGGFAAGVNAGLLERLLPGADVLLLNPDAEIDRDGVARLQRRLLTSPDLASVGPAQMDADEHPARVTWPFPTPGRTWLEALGLGRIETGATFVIGSVLLLRAEALEQLGGLDERFFLYAEETDWAARANQVGWRHEEVRDVVARHIGGATSDDPHRREVIFHASQETYQRKHFGALGWHAARVGQLLGSGVRGLVLPGERGRAARARAKLYLRGPQQAVRHQGER